MIRLIIRDHLRSSVLSREVPRFHGLPEAVGHVASLRSSSVVPLFVAAPVGAGRAVPVLDDHTQLTHQLNLCKTKPQKSWKCISTLWSFHTAIPHKSPWSRLLQIPAVLRLTSVASPPVQKPSMRNYADSLVHWFSNSLCALKWDTTVCPHRSTVYIFS